MRKTIISSLFCIACGTCSGALSAASITLAQVTGTQTSATIQPDASDIGKKVNIWIGAIYQGTLFLRNGSAWTPYSRGPLPVAMSNVALAASTSITAVDQLDVSTLNGVELYVGYGSSEQEMLNAPGKLAKILTVNAVRDTAFGKVQGALSTTYPSYYWAGIPYAAPPVGTLRWKAPTDPAPWPTTRSATSFGNACMQEITVSDDKYLGDIPQSEDCLTLNIWSPASGETNLPVLVFIHGGSNRIGYGGSSIYWGSRLANEQKVVVVTLNYRLGLFGWLNYAPLKTGDAVSDSGNYGTLDIIQALRFIRNNIAGFGGNPANVTISGQSAGAHNVWSLLTSPRAAGLFHKAAPLSGGLGGSATNAGTTFGDALLRQLVSNDGYADANAYIASNLGSNAQKNAYLYGKSASALIAAFSNVNNVRNYFVNRYYDGTVLPSSSSTALTGSYLNNVPVIVGVTNEEGKYWGSYFAVSPDAWKTMFSANPDNPGQGVGDVIKADYLPATRAFSSCTNSGYDALTLNTRYSVSNNATWCANGAFNTSYFWSISNDALRQYQALQPKTYAYNFKWAQQPEPLKTAFGAGHVADVPFLFGNANTGRGYVSAAYYASGYSTANETGREALSLKMRQFLAAFMRTGDPNNSSLGLNWTPWSPTGGSPKRLVLDADYSTTNLYMSTSDAPLANQ